MGGRHNIGIMDARRLLELQMEWGADEALLVEPRNRLAVLEAVAVPVAAPAALPAAAAPVRSAPQPRGAEQRAVEAAAACDTLEALRAALAGLSDCALADTAMHMVFGEGPEHPRLMLVGDCPGEDEDRSGRPYMGRAGGLLTRMLASIGITREEVRLVPFIAWRPPGNRPPTALERALCEPFLRRHIALARPGRLLLLGTRPAASLIGGTPAALRRMRGSWRDIAIEGLAKPVPALPSHAPEQLLINPALKREAWTDLICLRRALDADAAGG